MCHSGSTPSAPAAPVLPQYPGLSPEERDILQRQGVSLDQFNQIIQGGVTDLQQNQGILRQLTGLYGEDGTLNQDAVTALRTRVTGELDQRNQLGQRALGFLNSFFDEGNDPTQDDINSLEQTRYRDALRGNLPVSEGLRQQQTKDFQLLKESAGARGIRIEGDDASTATSESTGGIKMLSEFNKRYDLARENERQAAISQGASQNLARIGLMDAEQASAFDFATGLAGNFGASSNATLGFLNSAAGSSPANLAPLIQSYTGSLGAMAQPYAEQRLGQYDRDTNQVNANYTSAYNNYLQRVQARGSFFRGLGQLGGTVGTGLLLNPATMPIGAGVLAGTAGVGFLS